MTVDNFNPITTENMARVVVIIDNFALNFDHAPGDSDVFFQSSSQLYDVKNTLYDIEETQREILYGMLSNYGKIIYNTYFSDNHFVF